MPITPIDQLSGPLWASVGVAGKPKSGKTFSLSTLHKLLVDRHLPPKIAMFDLDDDGADILITLAKEQNWLPDLELHRFGFGKEEPLSKTPEQVKSRTPMEMFIDEANEIGNRVDANGKWKDGQALGAVVIDSMTALNEGWVRFIGAISNKTTGDFTWTEWRRVREKLLHTIRELKSLPCYKIFMFHEVLLQEEAPGPNPSDTRTTGQMLWVPKIQGDLCTTIQKEFSVFVHSRAMGNKYEWICQPDDRTQSVGSRLKVTMPARCSQDFANIL